MYLQDEDNISDVKWNDSVLYGDIYLEPEREYSVYNFEEADAAMLRRLFDSFEAEGEKLLKGRGLVYPAYDFCLKCSHAFTGLRRSGPRGRRRGQRVELSGLVAPTVMRVPS